VQWSKLGREYSEKLAAARPVYDLLKGIPNSRPLAGAYWRHRAGAPSGTFDPGQDNCGLMWVTAILPMTGFSAQGLMDLVEPIYSKHGVDPLITLTLINTRAVDAVMTIAYDREDEQHKLQANVCYKELFNTLMNAGYIPYRVGIQSMRQLNAGSEVFWDVVNEIKRALDPIGILSPGRYDPLSIEMMESSGILVSAQPPHLPPILSTQEIAPRFGID
jgi:4-cresol dehydrogenase (hydroxylating)